MARFIWDLALSMLISISYRAPTDNDRIGNISKRWHEWGLNNLNAPRLRVTKSGNSFKVTSDLQDIAGIEIKQTQIGDRSYRWFPDR